jgi:hypothetical protein
VLIELGVIFVLIEFGVISMLIHIQKRINIDKYSRHIKLIEIGVLSALINIQDVSS